MLQVNANKRPSIERILTLPFIKRHIQDFLSDIVSRPSGGIGDGTKMVKAAAINLADGGRDFDGEPKQVESLRNQLQTLGMQDLISKATGGADMESEAASAPPTSKAAPARSGKNQAPPEQPAAAAPAPRPSSRIQQRRAQARAQARALNREEERKKAVESALARLRAEREERLQRRNKIAVRGREQVKQQLPSVARGNKQVRSCEMRSSKLNAGNQGHNTLLRFSCCSSSWTVYQGLLLVLLLASSIKDLTLRRSSLRSSRGSSFSRLSCLDVAATLRTPSS